MGKRMLITSTDLMMIQFLVPHVRNLAEHGWKIDLACSVVGNRIDEVRSALQEYAEIHVVRLHRSPLNPENLKGYKDMKKVISGKSWDVIWTNEPVMGVVTRLAARKARRAGTKVVYMVHGFHFYKGAPKLNWMVYYPIERWMARFTDMIVTINKEDYNRAKGFHVKQVEYIPGIGIDLNRYNIKENASEIRQSLGVNTEDYLIISIGELTKRKNHRVVLDALKEINDPRIKYIICGRGPLRDDLLEYIHKTIRPYGWTCCWGNCLYGIDLAGSDGQKVHVRNKNTTEVSLNDRNRVGGSVSKWFRFNARNGKLKWGELNEIIGKGNILSEDGFRDFVYETVKKNPECLYTGEDEINALKTVYDEVVK